MKGVWEMSPRAAHVQEGTSLEESRSYFYPYKYPKHGFTRLCMTIPRLRKNLYFQVFSEPDYSAFYRKKHELTNSNPSPAARSSVSFGMRSFFDRREKVQDASDKPLFTAASPAHEKPLTEYRAETTLYVPSFRKQTGLLSRRTAHCFPDVSQRRAKPTK